MIFSIFALCVASAAILMVYYLSCIIYNFYFHPLAHIPGPWWAAVSYLPEVYYDVIKGGRYFTVIVNMHERYGPLVRVNPDQLHLNDPFFYEQVYAGNSQKTNKDKWAAELSGKKYALASIVDHEHHRRRRSYVANFFSKQSTLRNEPFIRSAVDKLMQKLTDSANHGETIVALHAFGALNMDIISYYSFGESFGELDVPGLPCSFVDDAESLMLTSHFRRFLPAVAKAMEILPESWLKWLSPALGTFFALDHKIHALCVEAQERRQEQTHAALSRTMFEALTEENVPPEEKTVEWLKQESIILLLAGVDTSARAVTSALCYLITFSHVLKRLRAELQTLGKSPSLSQLEALPYLTAFINETLRYQCIVTDSVPRVPQQPLFYNDLMIPAGTTIGARPWILNHHPDIFPDPSSFRPERWLEAEGRGENLTRLLFTFTKGTRICLGISLAYAELYLTVAALVQKFDFELVDSSIEDVTCYRDYAVSMNKNYGFGIKVRITKVLQD